MAFLEFTFFLTKKATKRPTKHINEDTEKIGERYVEKKLWKI